MALSHTIFTGAVKHGRKAAGAMAAWGLAQLAEYTAAEVIDSSVGFVRSGYDDWKTKSDDQLKNSSTDALTRALTIHHPRLNDHEAVKDDSLAKRVLDILQQRPEGVQEFATVMKSRAKTRKISDRVQDAIHTVGLARGCILGSLQAENKMFGRDNFAGDSGPQRYIKHCMRHSTDGHYISREPHEWRYMRDSQEWQRMLTVCSLNAKAALDRDIAGETDQTGYDSALGILSEAATEQKISFNASDYTYGNFVDLAKCRKLAEQIRKVRRLLSQAGSYPIIQMTGLGRGHWIGLALNNLDVREALNELIKLDVKTNSGQSGTIEPVSPGETGNQ